MIKILWSNLIKYMEEIELKKFDYKIQEVKKINLVDSNFIPQKIEEYIRENIKYKYVCSYNYKNNIINIEYYCSKKKKEYRII